jgi:hypothetical protein
MLNGVANIVALVAPVLGPAVDLLRGPVLPYSGPGSGAGSLAVSAATSQTGIAGAVVASAFGTSVVSTCSGRYQRDHYLNFSDEVDIDFFDAGRAAGIGSLKECKQRLDEHKSERDIIVDLEVLSTVSGKLLAISRRHGTAPPSSLYCTLHLYDEQR